MADNIRDIFARLLRWEETNFDLIESSTKEFLEIAKGFCKDADCTGCLEARFRQELFRHLDDGNHATMKIGYPNPLWILFQKTVVPPLSTRGELHYASWMKGRRTTEQPWGGGQEGGILWGTRFLCLKYECTQS